MEDPGKQDPLMKKITQQNIKNAFSSESEDYMKYLIFAEKAKEEGFSNVARLLQTIAYAERVHARKYLLCLDGLSNTEENLKASLDNEKFQVEELYPSLFEVAGIQNEVEAQIGFHGSQETEQVHAKLLQKALDSVHQNKDVTIGDIHICKNCGYTLEGEPPTNCPICGMPRERFKEF